jgi:hypothetical protein
MKKFAFALAGTLILFIFSCNHKEEDPISLVTRIQYDVLLKNPDPLPDYRHKYLDDSTRNRLLQSVLDPVMAGEITVYQWDNNKLVPGKQAVDMEKVTKIRYFEEWSLHKKSLRIDKKIMMVSLIQDDYDPQGNFRGTRPVLYLFYDSAFVTEYEQMCLHE